MLKNVRYCFLLTVASCLLLARPSMAEDGINGNLVDASWLAKNLQNSDIVILDASPETYAKQHLPGALSVNIYDLFAYGFGGMSDAKVEQVFQSMGISPGKKIVMYDAGADQLATRLFFDLDYHGVPEKDLFILDGGLFKWQKEGFPVTKEATPAPKNGTFKITKLKEELRGGLPEVVTASGDTANNALVEGLEPA